MRSAWYVVGLALGRVRRRGGGALVAALGIAAATAVLAGILAGATVAKDRGVAQDVERLPAEARAVRAVWFGVPLGSQEAWGSLDRTARKALSPLPAGEPTAVALVRESTVGGRFVGLAGVDGLAPHVQLRSGRLPRSVWPGALRGAATQGDGRTPERAGPAHRRGRHGHPSLAPPVRRLPRADRQRARRRRARAGSPRRLAVSPPAPGSARRRRGNRGARLLPGPRALVPLLRLGPGARAGDAAPLGDRRARRPGRHGAHGARGAIAVLGIDAPGPGAPRGRARRDRRGAPAAARRR